MPLFEVTENDRRIYEIFGTDAHGMTKALLDAVLK